MLVLVCIVNASTYSARKSLDGNLANSIDFCTKSSLNANKHTFPNEDSKKTFCAKITDFSMDDKCIEETSTWMSLKKEINDSYVSPLIVLGTASIVFPPLLIIWGIGMIIHGFSSQVEMPNCSKEYGLDKYSIYDGR